MANALAPQKTMTLGEGGLAITFTALAVLSIVIAAKAYTPEYAFHAYLFAAASIASVFAIINRYYERPAQAVPLTIDGKPTTTWARSSLRRSPPWSGASPVSRPDSISRSS
jgi:cytochrome c oxidase cbb3-type subunit 1